MSRANIFSSFALLFMLFNISANAQQYVTVDSSTYSAEELVRDIFIDSQNSGCITVSNVSAKGWQNFRSGSSSYGYFEKGTLPFDINKGIILSTRSVQNAPGPNNVLLDDQDSNWSGDPRPCRCATGKRLELPVLDYSDLRIKDNVSLQIFDRLGSLVFTSKEHQFIWDGKLSGRTLPTANYWYVLNWTEPDTQVPISYKGWILLKNRNYLPGNGIKLPETIKKIF